MMGDISTGSRPALHAVPIQSMRGGVKRLVALRHRVLVGTHHKTGTVWMQSVFHHLARQLGLQVVQRGHEAPTAPTHHILMRSHSDFTPAELAGDYRGLHVIRDPRDQIVSAAHYHTRAEEPWLHEKRSDFGGLTYQEKINSYANAEDRILFEMEHSARLNVLAMRDWDYAEPRFLNVRYEDLIVDRSLARFEEVFRHLGFREWSLGWCLVSAYRKSLFSGAVQSRHVRSGEGRQWPAHFTALHKRRFLELFGDVLGRLGYDDGSDAEWAAL